MNRIDIQTYTPKYSDKFFFDNNIWMYLYCPIGNHRQDIVKVYSDFFGKVLSAGSSIYVPSLILSEFYNAYSRLDFNIWRGKSTKDYKKDYRPTQQFKDISKTILTTIEARILGIAKRVNDGFEGMDIEKISAKCVDLDFNDSYYVELAKRNGFKVVTNDKDFLSVSDDIEIITRLNSRTN